MILFWTFVALMLAVALSIVAVPLWRGRVKSNSVHREAANLEIYRDQIAEMDTDLKNGVLSQEMYDQGKRELQSRLLDEAGQSNAAGIALSGNPFRMLALILVVLMLVLSFGIYSKVGNRHALLQQEMAQGNSNGYARNDAQLEELESQVDANPDDMDTLYKLARSYSDMERYEQAARAYDRLTQKVPAEAQLWADYADALAMAAGGNLQGEPAKLLDRALSLDPENFKALALSGTAAMERGDYAATVRNWENLLKLIPAENENARIIESGIQKARAMLAQSGGMNMQKEAPKSSAVGQERITGSVSLSSQLKAKASPEDTVFVLVRAAEGPKMPLAILRKQVKDLPLNFALDDSNAMSPQMKISSFEQLVVIARISKSGTATTQSGDMQTISGIVKPGAKGVKLKIDQVIP